MARAQELFYLGDWTQARFTKERAVLQKQLDGLRPVAELNVTKAGELLRDFGNLYRISSLEKRKNLLQAMLVKVHLAGNEICTITPQQELYPLMVTYSGGPDGIRVPMSLSYRREFVVVRESVAVRT